MAEEQTEQSPRGQSFDLERLSLAEKILAPIAIVIIVGWIVSAFDTERQPFRWSFFALSFFGALVVAVFVSLKLFGKRPLPPRVDRVLLSIASLFPAIGFLASQIVSLSGFLTVVGSIALCCVSVSAYWRKHIPEVAAETPARASPEGAATAAPAAPVREDVKERVTG
jgi:Na+/glutamate symporter